MIISKSFNNSQRFFFYHIELKILLFKFILIYNNFFKNFEDISKHWCLFNTDFYKSKINSICILTGRYGSVYRFFKISRIALRKFGGFNLIFGLRKSSW